MAWLRGIGFWMVLGLLTAGSANALPPVGEPAPAFSARRLADLQEVSSQELLPKGKTTLLSFFTTWCKPCEHELPALRELEERFGSREFRVVLVSLDQSEAPEIREFLQKVGVGGLSAVWDEAGDLMGLFGVFSLPSNILVDHGGAVRLAWQGYIPDKLKELEGLLEKLETAH